MEHARASQESRRQMSQHTMTPSAIAADVGLGDDDLDMGAARRELEEEEERAKQYAPPTAAKEPRRWRSRSISSFGPPWRGKRLPSPNKDASVNARDVEYQAGSEPVVAAPCELSLKADTFTWASWRGCPTLIIDVDKVPEWLVRGGVKAGQMVCPNFSHASAESEGCWIDSASASPGTANVRDVQAGDGWDTTAIRASAGLAT